MTNIFNFYANTRDKQDYVAVKDGFSILAFALGPIWSIYNHMWTASAISIVLYLLAYLIENSISPFTGQLLSNFMVLAYGFFAQDLIYYHLKNKGYVFQDVVLAPSLEEAEIKYLNKI